MPTLYLPILRWPARARNLLTVGDAMSQRTLNPRRRKLINFLIAEASANGILFLAGAIALSLKPADPTLALSANIVTIAAAAAVAIIPIVFFAITPILPRGHR